MEDYRAGRKPFLSPYDITLPGRRRAADARPKRIRWRFRFNRGKVNITGRAVRGCPAARPGLTAGLSR